MELKELLMFMAKKGASDLHLKPMRPPLLRIQGRLIPIKAPPLKPKEVEDMIMSILPPTQKHNLEATQATDVGYGVPGVARFRANVYYQRGTLAAVFRQVPFNIKSVQELCLPDVIDKFTEWGSGLVLVTGPTGSGKSTTLAAMIQRIAATRPCHIVTIEDPIEFLFSDNKATISQREVGSDTPNFKEALRNSMRQDPDVIMVGEMRDLETISTAITAAETGHLVFSTLHTNSAAQTIDRVIDSFPSDQQGQVRSQLSLVLRAIVSMKLVENDKRTKRLPVCEILLNSPKIAKHIENGEIKEIHEEMESSVSFFKMQSLNQSLVALLANGEISFDQATEASWDPDDLSLKLRRMFPSIEEQFRKGKMAPSPSDFSQIVELLETKKLYEEAEDRNRMKMAEKDELIADLQREMDDLRSRLTGTSGDANQLRHEAEQARAETQRLRDESNQKIAALNDRIRDLNQRLQGSPAPAAKGQTGFFKK